MKRAHLFGLYAGCAWAAYILLRTAVGPTKHVVGEGEFLFLAAVAPLALIAFIHSLLISIPSRIPVYYSGAIAAVDIALFLVYRVHFGFTGKDLLPAILTAATAAIMFLICAVIFYAVPALRWLYHRAVSHAKNA